MSHILKRLRFPKAQNMTAVWLAVAVFLIVGAASAFAQQKECDPYKDNTLYTIGYSHLDTQWRWTFQDSIYRFIANTMRDNFELFEKYPGYHFNFTGSKRYIMMKEYYPEDYEKLKEYIAEGKWYVSGASVDENDANVPSTESLVRNVLYGNLFFKNEFGRISEDYMLPDCFGFPAFMPSVLAHAGIKGFSTQKLSWGSAVGIPFNVGIWEGPDGRTIMAALNPGAYVSKVRNDISKDENWLERIRSTGERTGFYADFKYFGTGDQGGAPDENSVKWVMKSIESDGPICVDPAQSDDIFQDANEESMSKMKRHKGDMLLVEHSAGSITSQSYVKRWNRKSELLVDSAERTSVVADWLGAIPYPTHRIRDIWYLILGTQMHDILPGTSVPKAYEYSWNDAVMALNGAAGVIESAVGAASLALDTDVQGRPLVVYNTLSAPREDLVRATLEYDGPAPAAVRVFDPRGDETPSQIVSRDGDKLEILFLADAPAVGYSVYDVREAAAPCDMDTGLSITDNQMENKRFIVKIDENGDVSSIHDKAAGREVLAAPLQLELMEDSPSHYPAWNIDWSDWKLPPRAVVSGPAKIRIAENGPARVALEITREHEGSTFVQEIGLAAGDHGNRIEFDTSLDWRTQSTCLKAAFPLAVSNKNASYNYELGVIQRGTNHPKQYEVPSHQWFDLTDEDGSYGVSILEDSKYASDKPAANKVRLTLVRTPDCTSYCDQSTQDLGRHEMLFAMAPHSGDWRQGDSHWQALRLNQPLLAFNTDKHAGELGRSFSFLKLNSDAVALRAVKMAEESDEIIIRLQELNGQKAENLKVEFAAPIVSAREVDGQEREIGPATIEDGALALDMDPFYMRAFAVKIGATDTVVEAPVSKQLELEYNMAAMSGRDEKMETGFDSEDNAYPADILPEELTVDGVEFRLGEGGAGKLNAVKCSGQEIELPEGDIDRVYILASAADGDVDGTFTAGGAETTLNIQEWTGYVGQWDNRIWKNDREIYGLKPAYTKRAEIGWTTSHYHNKYGRKIAYNYSYLFKYGIDIPEGAQSITLPDDERIRIFAATAVSGDVESVTPAHLLYDDFDEPVDSPTFSPASGEYDDTISVSIQYPWYSNYSEMRFTTGGAEVSADSDLYRSPLTISDRTVIKARAYGDDGVPGLINIAKYEINDVTPPSIADVIAFDLAPTVIVKFSEPVEKGAAQAVEHYDITPGIEVTSAELMGDNMTAKLALSQKPDSEEKYVLTVRYLKDLSKNKNIMKEPESFEFSAAGPALDIKIRTKDLAYSLGIPGVSSDFSIKGKPRAVKGPFGLAARFRGNEDCIIINDRPELNPQKQITLAAWVRARTWDGHRRIMQKGDEDNQYRLLSENGDLLFHIEGVGEVRGELPAPGDWAHVAATYDGKRMVLYVNGEISNIKFTVGNIPRTGNPLHIGTKHSNGTPEDFFMGDMDKFMVWGYALPQEHIAVLAER